MKKRWVALAFLLAVLQIAALTGCKKSSGASMPQVAETGSGLYAAADNGAGSDAAKTVPSQQSQSGSASSSASAGRW